MGLHESTAGAGGGLVASIATCPLDVVKTKLQAQRAIKGQVGYEGVFGTSIFLALDAPLCLPKLYFAHMEL